MRDLLSVREAQEKILATLAPLNSEHVQLSISAGRILAETIQAPGDLPPFTNSSMDGFAVRAEDVAHASAEQPVLLQVIIDIPAGTVTNAVIERGQAARIMTGAPLPAGADSVVPVEETSHPPAQLETPEQVSVLKPVQPGANLRPRGMDVKAGQVLLEAGRILQPQDVGMLASIGRAEVKVFRKPRVALFSSGDELVTPGKPLGEGQIYDSNQYVLAAMLEREGAQVIRLGTAPDDPKEVEALLAGAVDQQADLIVTSAGVSVGAFDFVRHVIEKRGGLSFWRVNMRPGKPLAFGSFAGIPLIGLPGNPVSAFVGCRVFVLPAVYRLAGRDQPFPRREKAFLAETVESDGRESYLRAIVRNEGGKTIASLTGHQGSGNLFSLVQANALLIVPSGVKSLPSGSEVDIWFFETNE